MGKTKIAFHIRIENGYEAGLIEKSLKSTDYDASFFVGTKDPFQISENDFDILLLEPNTSQWSWLDLLIRLRGQYPELPIILYSRDISITGEFQQLSEELPVFLASDITVLKEKLAGIIKDMMRAMEEPTKSVLFVDDEQSVLSSFTRILRKSPWRILTAQSAEKALEVLAKESINLVVTDVKMPHVHGIELISKIRENFETLPILVCSAYPGMKDDPDLQFHDTSGFMEKPIDPNALKRRIRELLG